MAELLHYIILILILVFIPQILFILIRKKKEPSIIIFALSCSMFVSFIGFSNSYAIHLEKITSYQLTTMNNVYLKDYSDTQGNNGVGVRTYLMYEYYTTENNQIIPHSAYRNSSNVYITNDTPHVDIYYTKFNNKYLEKYFPNMKNCNQIYRYNFYINKEEN